ncbi:putative TPR repeat methyltransferase [Rhodopseudomonas rhenobacensis]|uniref:Putative TPR repeat methyltransferase n=1 Tax=Rhodopseudomonas rhenobacensis TaxID=87461 RepID=A0A7W8E100_9BRAD|nr:methyltransferase domain-containing protein [Rhodopseudomonas rhenobacensis]MBB5049472.1 putative TPR repeat methyltransferase [Rhodopseudomonas rhenobacensis]
MPTRIFISSGDMIADRRFDFARDLELRGELAAAEHLYVQATDLAPRFITAWFTLGEVRERLGDRDGAIAAFRQAQDCDPADRHGAGLRLIRLGAAAPAPMPTTYLRTLFDQYAPRFEAALVEELGYRGPSLLLKAVLATRAATRRPAYFRRAIDLGCGTGLAARAFATQTDAIIGFDLSPGMIERARATGLYAALEVAEIVDALRRQRAGSADLILAADVVIYLHDVAPLLAEVFRVLAPGGLLALTAETHDGDGVVLGAGLRYAHAAGTLHAAIEAAGLVVKQLERASARSEAGAPVPGLVIVAAKQ